MASLYDEQSSSDYSVIDWDLINKRAGNSETKAQVILIAPLIAIISSLIFLKSQDTCDWLDWAFSCNYRLKEQDCDFFFFLKEEYKEANYRK